MWRSLFLGLGLSCFILGAECLAIEKAVLVTPARAKAAPDAKVVAKREIVPPEWAPWSLMSAGAVVLLYSFTLPARARS